MGRQCKQWQTVFLGSKITADGDCSHEIKRWLLLGRKAVTNLDSILKSRGITLPTKVHLVKGMVFPVSHVWMWELDYKESWVLKNWCFRLLRVPWTARRSNQSILKEISPEYSLEGLMLKLKLQDFCHLLWSTDSFEKTLRLGKMEGRRRRGRQDEMFGGHHQLSGHAFEQALGEGGGQEAWVAAVHGVVNSWTRLRDWIQHSMFMFKWNLSARHPSASSHKGRLAENWSPNSLSASSECFSHIPPSPNRYSVLPFLVPK